MRVCPFLKRVVGLRNPATKQSQNNICSSRNFSIYAVKCNMSKPVLLNYFRSSASWRVRIALAHKGIDYEYKAVNLLVKEQYEEEFMKINPLGQVPAFVDNGNTITQSVAILEYLEEKYPEKPLFPKDLLLKTRVCSAKAQYLMPAYNEPAVREICELIGSGIQPLQNVSVLNRIDSENPAKRVEWAKFWIKKGFLALDKMLAQTSGKYCVGDEITLADCFLVPQAAGAARFKVDVSQFPNISRINAALKELEPFKKADAFVQPDCPEELRVQQRLE